MAGRIFISYRRGLDNGAAGRLYDWLEREFGAERLFKDVDTIPLGVDFVAHLDAQVAACDAFVAVIGQGWLQSIDRLSRPDDFVRIEIEAALSRDGIPVIPALIDDAPMPRPEDLPQPLRPLARRNGLDIPSRHFGSVVGGKLAPRVARGACRRQQCGGDVDCRRSSDFRRGRDCTFEAIRARGALRGGHRPPRGA